MDMVRRASWEMEVGVLVKCDGGGVDGGSVMNGMTRCWEMMIFFNKLVPNTMMIDLGSVFLILSTHSRVPHIFSLSLSLLFSSLGKWHSSSPPYRRKHFFCNAYTITSTDSDTYKAFFFLQLLHISCT